MLCSGLNGIAKAGGRGEPAVPQGCRHGAGAADARQRLGCCRGGSASAAARPAPLTHSSSSGVGSVGPPRAGGHPCQSQVSRAREQGGSRMGAGWERGRSRQVGHRDAVSTSGRAGCPRSCSPLQATEDEEETLFAVEMVLTAQQPPPLPAHPDTGPLPARRHPVSGSRPPPQRPLCPRGGPGGCKAALLRARAARLQPGSSVTNH